MFQNRIPGKFTSNPPALRLTKPDETVPLSDPLEKTLASLREKSAAGRFHEPADFAQQQNARRVRELAASLGDRYQPSVATFEGFKVYHANQRKALERLHAIAGRLDALTSDGSGVVLYGTIGTGKDHLAAGLLYQAAGRFGFACRWVSGEKVFEAFRDGMDKGRMESDTLRRYTQPDILCISDPLPVSGPQGDWNLRVLYRILDERYHHLRPTWATMNVATVDDAASRLTPPVFDRLRDRAELVPCFWPSYRRERNA